jgi:hypothetical protein
MCLLACLPVGASGKCSVPYPSTEITAVLMKHSCDRLTRMEEAGATDCHGWCTVGAIERETLDTGAGPHPNCRGCASSVRGLVAKVKGTDVARPRIR